MTSWRGGPAVLAAFGGVLVLAAVLGAAVSASAAEKTLRWSRYDVDLDVRADGSVLVRETQELRFTKGSFRWGQREILGRRLDSIDEVSVTDGEGAPYQQVTSAGEDGPFTFTVARSRQNVTVRYVFPQSAAGTTRTVVLEYVVRGVIRRYDAGVDQLSWTAIPAGNPFPSDASRLTLHLPDGVPLLRTRVHGIGATSVDVPGAAAAWDVEGPVRPGRDVEFVAEWPLGSVAGTEPGWQEKADREDARRRRVAAAPRRPVTAAPQGPVSALLSLALLAGGVLIGLGGVLGAILVWHANGRDPEVARIAPVIREPPSDLPPGVAATLIDERAGIAEIVGTILDLARRGHLVFSEETKEGILFDSTDHEVFRAEGRDALSPFEASVLGVLLGDHETRKLSALGATLAPRLPELTAQLDEEVVRRGFFPEAPGAIRKRWVVRGVILLAASLFGFFACMVLAVGTGLAAFLALPVGAFVAGLALLAVANAMPRRTRAGAEAAARWRAFREWLRNAERFADHPRAAELFGEYLPHAVALGVDSRWIDRFRDVNGPAPSWWQPAQQHSSGSTGHRSPATLGGHSGGGGHGGTLPSLARTAKGTGASLASASRSIGSMLSSAAAAFTPVSSGGGGGGGGFSGGGGSSGGGSGGGGSSFG